MKSEQLGDIVIDRIVESVASFFHPARFFDEALPEAIEPHRHWLEQSGALDPQTGNMIMPVQSYLIRTPSHTILIDTCVGCHKSNDDVPEWQNLRDESWLQRLQGAGVGVADIDYVFCTHLHLDHCGWNTRLSNGRWVPTFPNARYILATDEYHACKNEDGQVFEENVLPIMEAGQMVLVDSDYALDDEVWLTPSPGHTAGHVCVNIASRDRKATMAGDMMHNPLQLAYPEWSPSFDNDPGLSAETRKAILDSHCDTDTLLMTSHFPAPSMGRIVSHAERAYDFVYLDQ